MIKNCVICGNPIRFTKRKNRNTKTCTKACSVALRKQTVSRYGKQYRNQWRKKNPHKAWAMASINAHRNKGYIIHFTVNDLTEKAKRTEFCENCKTKLKWDYEKGLGFLPNSPVLDRTNNERDMRLDNIQILCRYCNREKQWLTQAEYERVLHDRLMIEKI